MNAARKGGNDAPPQAQNGPQAPPPAETAVRFDLSAPAQQAAAASDARDAFPSWMTATTAASAGQAGAPASTLSGSPVVAQGGSRWIADAAIPPRAQAATDNVPDPAIGFDDEAAARAWAIQSLGRENRLGLIEQIARMAERPEASQSAAPSRPAAAVPVAEAAEPRTLVRV
ncbi:hypothetical protein [Paracoccus sp. MC1862]|uniref:hypothetical protein n=2 Tax=Paracoccus TaxID=265 RepID=UPI0016021212|nr:hypothetical protein [Paracoccus sp. MC1862]